MHDNNHIPPQNNAGAGTTAAEPIAGAGDQLSWQVQAAQVAAADPLVEAFAMLTGKLHQPISVQQLRMALPVGNGKVGPAALVEAAEFSGFEVRVLKVELAKISPITLPCILLLKGERAAVLLSVKNGQGQILLPEMPTTEQSIAMRQLQADYVGYAIFARPAHLRRRVSEQDSYEKESGKWFWSALLKHRRIYRDVIIAALFVNIFAAISPLFAMNVYDRVVPNRAMETLWVLAGGIFLAYLFDVFLRGLRSYFIDAAGREADRVLAGRLYRHLMGMRLDPGNTSAGALADELRQFESVRDFFTSASLVALVDLPFVLLFLLMIWLIGGWLVLVPLVALPLALSVCWWVQKPLDALVKEGMRERALKNSLLVESITGLETIKTQNAEAEMQSQWSQLVDVGGRNWVKTRALSNIALNFAGWVAQIANVIMVVLGVYLIAGSQMTTGALVACTILLGRAMAPMASMASLLSRAVHSWDAFQMLDRFMQREGERAASRTYINRLRINGDFRFDNVSFQYPGQEDSYALRNINLHIRPGERVGVIGGMGSGKSTLIRLMSGLYLPTEGSLMVDGADIRQIDPSELRGHIGFVEQTPFLFSGSIRDNIAFGHREVDDATVLRAARIAGVTDFTSSTAQGLAQQVGERGVLLSGGQRQAVALARSFLFDPPILLMDEPTGAMDRAFENRFIDRMSSMIAGKTVVIVTHRQAMLALCDRLIIMDQGIILADGPKNEVLAALKAGQVRRPASGVAGGMGGLM